MGSKFFSWNGYTFAEQFASSKKIRFWVAFAGLVFLLLLGFKACSHHGADIPLYVIGEDINWTNINLMGKERSISAFSSDLMKEIALEEGARFRISLVQNAEILEKLESQDLDGILTALEPNVIYRNRFIFSEPYFLLGNVLVLPIEAKLSGFNEKAKKIIGVNPTDTSILQLENRSQFELKMYDNILKALSDVEQRRIDGAIFLALPAYIYTRTFYDKKLRVATTPLTNEGLRLMVLKGQKGEELIKLFNEGLATSKKNGKYDQLIKNWGLVNPEKIDLL